MLSLYLSQSLLLYLSLVHCKNKKICGQPNLHIHFFIHALIYTLILVCWNRISSTFHTGRKIVLSQNFRLRFFATTVLLGLAPTLYPGVLLGSGDLRVKVCGPHFVLSGSHLTQCLTGSNIGQQLTRTSYIRSCLEHFSIFLVLIFKVNLQVYFTYSYVAEFSFWSWNIFWQDSAEI